MTRTIKFRAWDTEKKVMVDWERIKTDASPLFLEGGSIHKIMQYTNLKDKNGVEIYEGDILTKNPRYKYKVIYRDEWGKYVLQALFWSEKEDRERPIYLAIMQCPRMEVIGNIYETPELLKQ